MPTLQGRISDEAHRSWHRLAGQNGVSMNVLLEVIGENLGKVLNAEHLEALMKKARVESHERRRQGGPKRKGTA